MKKTMIVCLLPALCCGQVIAQPPAAATASTLWYHKPAGEWVEALPVGNGRIGAMIFGGVEEELLQLNESSLYSGGPVKKTINPDAYAYLPKVREALLQNEDYTKANALTRHIQGLYTESYLPLGDLVIRQSFQGKQAVDYYRGLDLSNAVATTRFTVNGVTYSREVFASAPGNIMVIRLTASVKGQLTATVSARSQLRYRLSVKGREELVVSGKAPAHVDPSYYSPKGREHVVYTDTTGCNGMRYQFRIRAVAGDGSIRTDTAGIHIRDASEVILYVAAATSFNGFDKCPDAQGKDEQALANAAVTAAVAKGYAALRAAHIKDYQSFYNRVSFTVKDTMAVNPRAGLPSDERLQAYTQGGYDPGMEMLYFRYGRYLLIAASRPGGPPANLQGLWNKELRAPWSSNYTININTQMNYWPAELTNLSEMHQPLLRWLQDLAVNGAAVAKEFYHAAGWVAHHNSEIWGTANPVGDKGAGDPVWANWAMGANWLCQHLWEHYAFTRDTAFLRQQAYPLMKQAALFCLDWLVPDRNGYLVTAPSTSPENTFRDSTGKAQAVSVATTMDMSIIRDLFTNLAEAAQVLQTDTAFRQLVLEKRQRLYPMHIGSKGQLQEWYKDFAETDPQHRHASHLFGLYPGRELSARQTPALFRAARKTLELRGDGGTGWSKGWKINWWARLGDGDHAYHLIRELLTYTDAKGTSVRGGGTYPNFFDAHPPFQIDGNFAGTAGMAELLLQSQEGEVHLLPALPAAWAAGEVHGLVARGAFEVSMYWQQRSLSRAAIKARKGGNCIIRAAVPLMETGSQAMGQWDGESYVLTLATQPGVTYQLVAGKASW